MTVLETKRLKLSWGWPPAETELGTIVGWLNDPIVTQYSEQRHQKHTIESQYRYIKTIRPYDIYARIYDEHRMIGVISATVDIHNQIADVGILMGDRSRWGKGYGLEAWSSIGKYLTSCGVRRMEAGCMAANIGMMRICDRYGMVEEGRRKAHFICDGRETDLVFWGKPLRSSAGVSIRGGQPVVPEKQRQAVEAGPSRRAAGHPGRVNRS